MSSKEHWRAFIDEDYARHTMEVYAFWFDGEKQEPEPSYIRSTPIASTWPDSSMNHLRLHMSCWLLGRIKLESDHRRSPVLVRHVINGEVQ